MHRIELREPGTPNTSTVSNIKMTALKRRPPLKFLGKKISIWISIPNQTINQDSGQNKEFSDMQDLKTGISHSPFLEVIGRCCIDVDVNKTHSISVSQISFHF